MNSKQVLKSICTVVATAAILTPGIALADRYTDSIVNQLVRAGRIIGLRGYKFTDADAGKMNPSSAKYLTVNLNSGRTYKFIGVCDQDCGDVDLRLYDENGNVIDTDTDRDDIPVVGVTPRWSGKFTVKVSMASCRANYCYYGIGLFRR